jgi:hypothetical protein
MATITRKCCNCGTELKVINVTEGAGTATYEIGCLLCGLDDSGGEIHSSTVSIRGNANTMVNRLPY